MTKLTQILEWKKKWGYDDFAVMPGGRPMKAFSPDRKSLDDFAMGVEREVDADLAERMRAKFENPAARRLKALRASLDKMLPESPSVEQARLAKEVDEEIARIRLSDEPPKLALVHKLAEAIRERAPDEASSLDEWHDDLQQPYDPAQGPLATSIADRIRNRNILDRSAAIDQVTGRIYSTDRREELAALTGNHYLAKAFGLRAIREEVKKDQKLSGILFDHDASSRYQRDDLAPDVTRSMAGLYKAYQRNTDRTLPNYNPNQVFFVNNANVAAKLDKMYTPQWLDPHPNNPKPTDHPDKFKYRTQYARTVPIKPGVFALVMTNPVDGGFKSRLLEGSGSTPSAYQVEKVKDPSAAKDPLLHPSMRDATLPPNDTTLARVAASPGCKGLAQLPEQSPMKQAALAASTMVSGLETALAKLKSTPTKWAAVKDNKLVANALQKIERLMETMPSYTEDVPRFSRLFDLLVDEVYLVLATCKPYGKDDYRQAAGAMIDERIPTLKDGDMAEVKHSTAMLSSGMDGLSTAVAAAFTLTGSKKLQLIDGGGDHSSNYFELEGNLLGSATMGPSGAVGGPSYTPPVIMGTLNPSTPVKQAKPGAPTGKGDASWSVAALVAKINAVLNLHMALLTEAKPAVAIIDVTVERNATGHDQEMDKLVADPTIKKALKEGKLTLMLAKSYQKYPSLGAGKAMAGGLTVIGKGIAPDAEPLKTVNDAEAAEGLLPGNGGPGHDESQIVAHFMTHERGAERSMMERAAKNAKFVRGLMPADSDVASPHVRFDDGLPFLVFKKESLAVKGKKKPLNVSSALHAQGVEERMSFGFQNTSCLGFGDLMRVGVGQESEPDLVEKLYAITNLAAKPEPGGITPDKTIAMAGKAANKAMAQAKAALAERGTGDVAWRERMVRVLIDAGQLKSTEVKRDTTKAITAPNDTDLQRRLDLIVDDRSETDLGKLGGKLALAAALRPQRVTEPALALSTAKTPDDADGRAQWIAKAEGALKDRGIALPTRAKNGDADDKKYVAALRGALHGADDANLAHANAARTFDGPGGDKLQAEAQFLPNMVASCANLISTSLDDPAKFAQLADVLIKQGLAELSPEGQERLLYRRVQASLAGSGTDIVADLGKLKDAAEKMPYREGLANLVNGSDLEEAAGKSGVGSLTDDNVRDIVKALAGPLDLTTQCDLFGQLVAAAAKPAKKRIAQQCKRVLDERFATLAKAYLPPNPREQHVDPPMGARDIRKGASGVTTHGPQPMTKEQFEKLKLAFETLALRIR